MRLTITWISYYGRTDAVSLSIRLHTNLDIACTMTLVFQRPDLWQSYIKLHYSAVGTIHLTLERVPFFGIYTQRRRIHMDVVQQGKVKSQHIQADEIRAKGRKIIVWIA